MLCARTTDGGKNIEFLSWVTPAVRGYSIMPAGLRLSPDRLLCAVRCSERQYDHLPRCWIDLYASDDNGASWEHFSRSPTRGRGGNPPTLTKLQDGACASPTASQPPFGMYATFSEDDGATWESRWRCARARQPRHRLPAQRTVG